MADFNVCTPAIDILVVYVQDLINASKKASARESCDILIECTSTDLIAYIATYCISKSSGLGISYPLLIHLGGVGERVGLKTISQRSV